MNYIERSKQYCQRYARLHLLAAVVLVIFFLNMFMKSHFANDMVEDDKMREFTGCYYSLNRKLIVFEDKINLIQKNNRVDRIAIFGNSKNRSGDFTIRLKTIFTINSDNIIIPIKQKTGFAYPVSQYLTGNVVFNMPILNGENVEFVKSSCR